MFHPSNKSASIKRSHKGLLPTFRVLNNPVIHEFERMNNCIPFLSDLVVGG